MKHAHIINKGAEEGKRWADSLRGRAFKAGGYSLAAAALVVAIAVAANLAVGALPSSMTDIDMTDTGIYSISGQTQQVVSALEEDVDVYWIVQDGEQDVAIEQMLSLYEDLSKRLSVVQIDPVVYPNFALEYTDEAIYNNSLIVVCGERSRYISYNDIYTADYENYYTTGQIDYGFAGEGELTSAISYVTSEDLPTVYALTGHGEDELPSSLQDGIQRDNILLEELSLLSLDSVPSDAGALIIYSPQSDISKEEADMILEYLQNGGRLLLITDYLEQEMENLMDVTEYYGATLTDGIVIESDPSMHLQGLEYYLLPTINYHQVTEPLYSGGYYVMTPIAQGISISQELREGLSVTELLTTSDDAYSKVGGYDITTYDKEEGDIDGPFSMGVAISEESEDGETRLVWLTSSMMFDDTVDQVVSGANSDLFLNSLSWMCGQEDTISIRPKSLGSEYLTVTSASASLWSFVLIGLVPMCFLGIGAYTTIRRRKS